LSLVDGTKPKKDIFDPQALHPQQLEMDSFQIAVMQFSKRIENYYIVPSFNNAIGKGEFRSTNDNMFFKQKDSII